MMKGASVFPRIVCPIDKVPLTESAGYLVCPDDHKWPIRQGIPRMVLHESNYADAFGLQWNTYRTTQLDSYTKTTISYDRLRRCLGKDCWSRLHGPERVDVLEAGCGAGRFSEVLLATPSACVTSTDLSSAVEANQDNCPQDDRHRVIQSDILQSPFSPGQFDIVLCLGVVQHTPRPEETISKLYAEVKPGGWLVFDHYTYSLSVYTRPALLIQPVLKRLSPAKGLKWTELLVKVFLPLHQALGNRRILQKLLSRVSPIIAYYDSYPQLNDEIQRQWALLDTHDYLTDYYKHLRTKGQIEKALRNIGALDIHCEYAGNGVEARCRKAST